MDAEGTIKDNGHVEGRSKATFSRHPLRSSVFDPSNMVNLQQEYAKSQPYRHLVIPDLMDDEVLRGACEELKTNMQATLKETDIFKVTICFL